MRFDCLGGDMYKLSEHFSLEEFTRSESAVRKGIKNIPTAQHIENMKYVCESFLEKIRKDTGALVLVTSGYRCKELNKAIGGSEKSQHCSGEAVDFTVKGRSNKEICIYIQKNIKGFDQLIYEGGESGWIHLSASRKQSREEVLTATFTRKTTKYIDGIV